MRAIRQYEIKSITEFIIAIDTPCQYICPAESMTFFGVSCERSDDREGIVRLNYQKQSIQFECPVAVLMDSSLRVSEGQRTLCMNKVNAILDEIREHHKGDAAIVMQAAEMAQAFVQVLEPMIHITSAPFQLQQHSFFVAERLDDNGKPIDRPVRLYLRGLKVETVR